MCARLMRLWLGMGYRAAWRFRDVSRNAKGLGTSSKLHLHYIYAFSRRFYPKRLTLHSSYSFTFYQLFKLRCYVGLRIVTLSKNLIKYENRYSQKFNIGYRELHATYMDFFYFVFNDPPQPAPQIK